ncbi:hypothetical protein ABID56_001173 [Alkalibacillus flavidus]|uniref:ABC-2 family transporter protein n=1 Tax=Alkalibacillus flavidus TaxID=546021 RepID=A0ABV2KU21_9BACI
MQTASRYQEVARRMFVEQLKWSIWFIVIAGVFVRGGLFVMAGSLNVDDVVTMSLLEFMLDASKIYMLVIGILSVYVFMNYLVRNGITRRDYFLSTVISTVGLAVTFLIIFSLLTIIEMVIINVASINVDINTLTVMSAATLNIQFFFALVLYFSIGWFITIGFYRYNWMVGLGFILLAIGATSLTDMIWGQEGMVLFGFQFTSGDMTLILSILSSLILTAILWGINRRLTRDINIKL